MPNPQEVGAVEYFKKWVRRHGGRIESKFRSGVGYDFTVYWRGGKRENFEVKGSKKIRSIPDMSTREFENKQMIADHLFVVGNVLKPGNEVVYKIPRSAIKPEHLQKKSTYHIARFQNQKNMDRFVVMRENNGT